MGSFARLRWKPSSLLDSRLMVALATLRLLRVRCPTSCNASTMCKSIISYCSLFIVSLLKFSTKQSKESCKTEYFSAFECMRNHKADDNACAYALD